MQRSSTVLVVALAAAGALWWWSTSERGSEELASAPQAQTSAHAARERGTSGATASEPMSAPEPPEDSAPTASDAADEPVAQTNDKVFRLDANDQLVLDAHTRLNLEALIARTPPEALGAAKQEIAALLPPGAAAQAAELIDRYYEYDIAQRQTYPPGRAPSTEEEALAELEGLHALREAHFGAEIARAFYAEDEAVSRELLELMKLEKDQSLTLAEKAERAQRMRDAQQ